MTYLNLPKSLIAMCEKRLQEDDGADAENKRQRDKIAQGDKMKTVTEEDDAEDKDKKDGKKEKVTIDPNISEPTSVVNAQ
jgi:hypothetical protein